MVGIQQVRVTPVNPLGKYAQVVAAVVALGTIASAIFAHLVRPGGDPFLDNLAFVSLGAVFGAQGVVNGIKRDIGAVNTRLDMAGVPAAKNEPGQV